MNLTEQSPCREYASEALAAFRESVERIVLEHRASAGPDDIRHVRVFDWIGRVIGLTGYILAAWQLNPLSPILIVIAQMGRWGLAHQILHHSYDHIPNCPDSLNGTKFGRGWRRLWDWGDWIIPEAWQMEHNIHHVYTGSRNDPDVVEANLDFLRRSPLPIWRKAGLALLIMCTWRLTYYAPSTLLQLRSKERRLAPITYDIQNVWMFGFVFNPLSEVGRDFWRRCILPYASLRFVGIPLLFATVRWDAAFRVFVTQIIAEVLLNFYSWALIASTHTAPDMFRFDHEPSGKEEWYLHQNLGTANYTHRSGWGNWSAAWINYQIEHHLGPNLTLLQLERCTEPIHAACVKYSIPFVTEALPRRFVKMFSVVLGIRSMRRG